MDDNDENENGIEATVIVSARVDADGYDVAHTRMVGWLKTMLHHIQNAAEHVPYLEVERAEIVETHTYDGAPLDPDEEVN
jgi:hypothetical protein